MKTIIFKAIDMGEVHNMNALIAKELHGFSKMKHEQGGDKGAVFAPLHVKCDLTGDLVCVGMIASAPDFNGLKLPISLMVAAKVEEVQVDANKASTLSITRDNPNSGRNAAYRKNKWIKFLVSKKGMTPEQATQHAAKNWKGEKPKEGNAPYYWYKSASTGLKEIPIKTTAKLDHSIKSHSAENTMGFGKTLFDSRITAENGFLLMESVG